jgi:hypothetical protein
MDRYVNITSISKLQRVTEQIHDESAIRAGCDSKAECPKIAYVQDDETTPLLRNGVARLLVDARTLVDVRVHGYVVWSLADNHRLHHFLGNEANIAFRIIGSLHILDHRTVLARSNAYAVPAM